jgi:hypothetical protein
MFDSNTQVGCKAAIKRAGMHRQHCTPVFQRAVSIKASVHSVATDSVSSRRRRRSASPTIIDAKCVAKPTLLCRDRRYVDTCLQRAGACTDEEIGEIAHEVGVCVRQRHMCRSTRLLAVCNRATVYVTHKPTCRHRHSLHCYVIWQASAVSSTVDQICSTRANNKYGHRVNSCPVSTIIIVCSCWC